MFGRYWSQQRFRAKAKVALIVTSKVQLKEVVGPEVIQQEIPHQVTRQEEPPAHDGPHQTPRQQINRTFCSMQETDEFLK